MMNRTPRHSLRTTDCRLSTVDRGFTFVEVLFAIIILGIGMIMLAAMLPVAISQTAQTRDQIAGKGAVEAGYAYIRVIANSGGSNAFPVTGASVGMMQPATSITAVTNPPGLNQYTLSRIMSSDPAVQWTPFYRRDAGSNIIRFVVLATRISSNEAVKEYSTATLAQETDLDNPADVDPTVKTNGPHLYRVSIEDSKTTLGEYDELTFHDELNGNVSNPPMAAAGTYVIIREQNEPTLTTNPQSSLRNNGRVFKLLSKKDENPSNATWFLDPDFDLPAAEPGPDNVIGTPDDIEDVTLKWPSSADKKNQATAWIVGRAALDPTGNARVYSGVSQDIGILKFDLTVGN